MAHLCSVTINLLNCATPLSGGRGGDPPRLRLARRPQPSPATLLRSNRREYPLEDDIGVPPDKPAGYSDKNGSEAETASNYRNKEQLMVVPHKSYNDAAAAPRPLNANFSSPLLRAPLSGGVEVRAEQQRPLFLLPFLSERRDESERALRIKTGINTL